MNARPQTFSQKSINPQRKASSSIPRVTQRTTPPLMSQPGHIQTTQQVHSSHPTRGPSGTSSTLQHPPPGPSGISNSTHQQPVFSTPVHSNQVFIQSQENQGLQYLQTQYIPGSAVDQNSMNNQFIGHDGSFIGHNMLSTN